MSSVRVLVGTKKGALHPHVRRQTEEVERQRPALRRLGDVSPEGLAGRSQPDLRLADQRLVRAGHSALRRRRQDVDHARQQSGGAQNAQTACPKGRATSSSTTPSRPAGKPLTTHQWYDGTQHPWEFKRVWHLEPSLTDPDTVYAGVEDAALFRSTDGGKTWHELAGLRGHGTGPKWSPGAGGMGLHTIVFDPTNPKRIYIAISAAGTFRTDDGGTDVEGDQPRAQVAVPPGDDAGGRLLRASHRDASVAARRAVHAIASGWRRLSQRQCRRQCGRRSTAILPTDFGFPIDVHAHEPNTIYAVPMDPNLRVPPEGKLRVYRSKTGGNEWEPLTKGLPQENCYVNVLRDAMAVDQLDECGIYFGTTGGQVYCSPDGGDNWQPIVRDLPGVLSVEVQTIH